MSDISCLRSAAALGVSAQIITSSRILGLVDLDRAAILILVGPTFLLFYSVTFSSRRCLLPRLALVNLKGVRYHAADRVEYDLTSLPHKQALVQATQALVQIIPPILLGEACLAIRLLALAREEVR